MRRLAQWAAVAIVVVALMVITREPQFWKRYGTALMHGSSVPLSFYQPRELVEGGNMPPAPRVSPALESLDAEALQKAADYAAGHNSRALIVTRHGHIVFERYWHGTGFDTLEDSQSFARTVTALLTGIAIGDRKIGWPDEPIGNFIPEWRNDPRGTITVRNLLQMSSGLGATGPAASPWSALARERFGPDVISEDLSQTLVARPGETWLDQPADPQLLSLVIERAAKQRYAQYLSEGLWRRIGAADAWGWLDRAGGSVHADCCLLVRQGDWIRVGELLVNNGRYQGDEIVPPGWVAQMLLPTKGNPSYGAYVRVKTGTTAGEPYALPDVFAVEGRGHRMWVVPSLQMVILRTGDSPGAPGNASFEETRIPNLIIRGARDYVPQQARPGVDLKSLVPNH